MVRYLQVDLCFAQEAWVEVNLMIVNKSVQSDSNRLLHEDCMIAVYDQSNNK